MQQILYSRKPDILTILFKCSQQNLFRKFCIFNVFAESPVHYSHIVIHCLSNFRVYCHHCIDLLAGDGAKKWIREKEPWLCFLCDDALPSVRGLIKRRPDWMNCNKVCI